MKDLVKLSKVLCIFSAAMLIMHHVIIRMIYAFSNTFHAYQLAEAFIPMLATGIVGLAVSAGLYAAIKLELIPEEVEE